MSDAQLPATPHHQQGSSGDKDRKASPAIPPPPPFNTPAGDARASNTASASAEDNKVTEDSLAKKLAGLSVQGVSSAGPEEGEEAGPEAQQAVLLPSMVSAGQGEDGGDEDVDDEEEDEDGDGDGDEVDLPPEVMKRLYKLKALQSEKDAVYSRYEKERAELENKFSKLYGDIYSRRADIVTGRAADASAEGTLPVEMEDGDEQQNAAAKEGGVPHFWMQCMLHHEALRDVVCMLAHGMESDAVFECWRGVLLEAKPKVDFKGENDLEALYYLSDVRCVDKENLLGFTLEFHFDDNPFFSNPVLTKRYDTANIMDQGEPLLEGVDGTKIQWKAGRNLCQRTIRTRKKRGGKAGGDSRIVTKVEKTDSFFKFFLDPIMYDDDDDDEEEHYNFSFDMDYEVARIFRNHIIPNAVLWFTGEAVSDDDEDGEDDDDEEEEEEDNTDGLSDEDGRVHDADDDDDHAEEEEESGNAAKRTLNFQAPAGVGAPGSGLAGGQEQQECKQS